MEYGVSDDYLDEQDDGIMYSTQNYHSDSDDDNLSAFSLPSNKNKKLTRKRISCGDSESDEDDFEKQMNAELSKTMQKLTVPMASTSSKASDPTDSTKPEYYDSIYFDSDDSDKEEVMPDDGNLSKNEKHKVLTNDELFYDPLKDDADQAWVDKNRRSYQFRKSKIPGDKTTSKLKPLPHSDAVLNCPACFTTLCLDCQRHEIYKNQYRAMFVFNCEVDRTEVLHFAIKEDKKFKKGKNRKRQKSKNPPDLSNEAVSGAPGEPNLNDGSVPVEEANPAVIKPCINGEAEDNFNPVKCTVCNTKVAVIDREELYHFFNVITSY